MEKKVRPPSSGIYTDKGFLFRHSKIGQTGKDGMKRLQEHGIFMKRTFYKREEDDIIRNNWKKFADDYKLNQDKAQYYSGMSAEGRKEALEDANVRRRFVQETNFWPRICDGLPHRNASSVQQRMSMIFDPVFVSGEKEIVYGINSHSSTLTLKEEDKLWRLYREKGDYDYVCQVVRQPFQLARKAIRDYPSRFASVKEKERPKLWKIVLRTVKDTSGKDFEKSLRLSYKKLDRLSVTSKKNEINFREVSLRMRCSEESCGEQWDQIINKMYDLYESAVQSNGISRRAAWESSRDRVVGNLPPISLADWSLFLQIATPLASEEQYWFRSQYSICIIYPKRWLSLALRVFIQMELKMLPIYFKLSISLYFLWRTLRRRLRVNFSIRDQVTILRDAFILQVKRKNFPRQVISKPKLHGLHRTNVVEALVLKSFDIEPDFIPPTKLKRYVIDPCILRRFPGKKNNSWLLDKNDRRLLQSYRIRCLKGKGEKKQKLWGYMDAEANI